MANFGTLTQTFTIKGKSYGEGQGLAEGGFKFDISNEKWTHITGQGGTTIRGENQNSKNATFEITAFINTELYNLLQTLYNTGEFFSITNVKKLDNGQETIFALEGCDIQKPGQSYILKPQFDASTACTTFTGFCCAVENI